MNLAAVLVHFGDPDITHDTLKRLESSKKIQTVICVLHDELPHQQSYSRTVFLRSENLGYAAGINRAVRHLQAQHPSITHAIALNPDVEISDSEIQALISEHETSGADCTFSSIREGSVVIQGYHLNRLGLLRPTGNGAHYYPGTCFLFSLDSWKKAGEMNEKYFHFFEDIDFCVRLRKAGLRMHPARNVILKHQGKSRADYPATDFPRFAVRNHLQFLADIGKLNKFSFFSVTSAHFLYLFRWKRGWRGIKAWMKGIQEFKNQ